MNVLSLFDGISCGRVALDRAGINVKNYYASEIDKFAIKVSEKNYPDIVRVGDVTEWRTWSIDWASIDLLIGGSPCQGLSFAGKRLKLDDPRSKLFFEYLDILRHIQNVNPSVKFLLENVNTDKITLNTISELLCVDPVCINSSLVSAQNRIRNYWSNFQIEQPKDKHIYLKDIIINDFDHDESHWITGCAMRGRYTDIPNITRQQIEFRKDGKANALTSVSKGSMVGLIQIGVTGRNGYESNNRIYSIDGKCPTLTANSGGNSEKKIGIIKGQRLLYRNLAPVECERLQTLPDNYTDCVSKTQRYKQLGNGWTVDVVAHIFKGMK